MIIRLRTHDRKMLKMATALTSMVLVVLGVVWVDLQRHPHAILRGVPRERIERTNQQHFERLATHESNIFTADYLHPQGGDRLFYPDGSNVATDAAPGNAGTNHDYSSDSRAFDSATAEGQSSIPEPSTLGLLGVGALLLMNRRRVMRKLAA